MKKLKIVAFAVLSVMLMVLFAGCYVVSGQRMKRVQGTYELISYSRTNGKTNAVTNYLEVDGYQAFLVVTGSGTGYYVFRDNDTPPTVRQVSLRYEYNQEDSKKVDYVFYRFEGQEEQKFGVTRDSLSFSKPAIKLSENIYTDGLSMSWRRADEATDLSYVEEQWGTLQEYAPKTDENVGV